MKEPFSCPIFRILVFRSRTVVKKGERMAMLQRLGQFAPLVLKRSTYQPQFIGRCLNTQVYTSSSNAPSFSLSLSNLQSASMFSTNAQEQSLTAEEVAALTARSREIFGNLPLGNVRTGNKILRKKFIGPMVTRDHHKSIASELKSAFPEFMTDVEERRKTKLAYLRRRGKGPPKKGEGKRAAKRGKKK